ncbi:hypothetical protein AGMMS49975_00230 [Clostridia bacterium]|nr:hypothetical protein AGMMS49975_00230 [Clostridia bacterium]
MKRVAVLQSNYIPWKGYFDIIHDVDLFIFHDDLQYTKDDWRNRNKIKTENGLMWLSVPVGRDEHRLICDVKISDFSWQKKHYENIRRCYAKAPCFSYAEQLLRNIYLEKRWDNLSVMNRNIIERVSELLGIQTQFADSRDFRTYGAKQEKLLSLLIEAKADLYISGPAAKNYITESEFEKANIKLIYKNYADYPEYKQCYGVFEHKVSVLDLLMNEGEKSSGYIWGFRGQ